MNEPVRIFIGAAPNGHDAESCAVLEYTLRKNASRDISITRMILSRDPASPFYSDGTQGWQTERWPTPFSPFRFSVPSLCGFEGRAIYMDSDLIALDYIAKLYDQEFDPGRIVIAKSPNRLCVSLWDCARAKDWMLPLSELRQAEGHYRQSAIIREGRNIVQPFKGGNWNCLDLEDRRLGDPDVKVIHYSSMPHQPSSAHALKRLAARGSRHWFDGVPTPHWRGELQTLFDGLLIEAGANGFRVADYDPGDTFGPYKKANLRALAGAKPGWAG